MAILDLRNTMIYNNRERSVNGYHYVLHMFLLNTEIESCTSLCAVQSFDLHISLNILISNLFSTEIGSCPSQCAIQSFDQHISLKNLISHLFQPVNINTEPISVRTFTTQGKWLDIIGL